MGYFAQIRQDEYPATDELQCIAVHIPAGDEYKALLAGFIALLSDVSSYVDPDSAQADGVAATFDEGYAQTNWDGCGVPPECVGMNASLYLLSSMTSITSGGSFIWTADATSEGGGFNQQNPAATADQFRWTMFLSEGHWTYQWTYLRNTVNGKGDFYITADFATYLVNVNFDMRGVAQRNTRFENSFTVPAGGGQYVIGLNGTGASSGTSYNRPFQRLLIWKDDP